MRLGFLVLVLGVISEKIEYSAIVYGVLEGARLVDPVAIKRCTHEISREKAQISFRNLVKDGIAISNKCGWTIASKTLEKFQTQHHLMDKSEEDFHGFLLTITLGHGKNHRNDGKSIGKILESQIASMSPTVLSFTSDRLAAKSLSASPYPIAVFHGLGDCCCFPGMIEFTRYLGKEAGTYSKCVEVGDGPPASWLMAFQTQVNTACADLMKDTQFANGVNIVGLSQGGLIARVIPQMCNVTVHNVITLGGPHMGVMSLPNCESGFYCDIFNDALDLGVYDPFVQNHFGPPGYFKDQYKYEEYLSKSGFLAAANNEKSINANYAKGFKSINQLVLIEFTEDTIVDPKESEQFGYYENNSKKLLAYNETTDYLNDVLGLKTLDSQGKIVFEYIVGNHLQFNTTDIDKYVIPYLT